MLPQDPMILLSYLNTKLRDFYPTLDALCDDLQIDGGEVSRRLAAIDCRYSPERNQFVSWLSARTGSRKHPRPPIFSASKE